MHHKTLKDVIASISTGLASKASKRAWYNSTMQLVQQHAVQFKCDNACCFASQQASCNLSDHVQIMVLLHAVTWLADDIQAMSYIICYSCKILPDHVHRRT